jgi:hypothetical protein
LIQNTLGFIQKGARFAADVLLLQLVSLVPCKGAWMAWLDRVGFHQMGQSTLTTANSGFGSDLVVNHILLCPTGDRLIHDANANARPTTDLSYTDKSQTP